MCWLKCMLNTEQLLGILLWRGSTIASGVQLVAFLWIKVPINCTCPSACQG